MTWGRGLLQKGSTVSKKAGTLELKMGTGSTYKGPRVGLSLADQLLFREVLRALLGDMITALAIRL